MSHTLRSVAVAATERRRLRQQNVALADLVRRDIMKNQEVAWCDSRKPNLLSRSTLHVGYLDGVDYERRCKHLEEAKT
jgi:hypothetical protein